LPPSTWLELETAGEFDALLPLGTKEAKKLTDANAHAVFKTYTVGVLTARDEVAYDFNRAPLVVRMEKFVEDYNAEVDRYHRAKKKQQKSIDIDKFVRSDLKWTHNLKQALAMERSATTAPSSYRRSLYRPFCKKWLFFDRMLNERVYLTPGVFPNEKAEAENMAICCTIHTQMPFTCMVTNVLPNEAIGGRNGQCFGLYTYSSDGSERSDNITDWAISEFQDHYGDPTISKLDVFHYVYAILHHPIYRERFAQNLQKEIPRVPAAKEFRLCARIGERLVDLHLNFEQAKRFELDWIENPDQPLSCRVTGRMRLNKEAATIEVNSSLTLAGIPEAAFDYVLGTRSALEWIVDQYRYEEDEDGNVTSDPNDPDQEQYVVQLTERVTTVSLETLELIRELPSELDFSALQTGRKRVWSL